MKSQLVLPNAGNSWYIENMHLSGLSPTVWADPEQTRVCHYVRSDSVTLWGQLQCLFEARAKRAHRIHLVIVYGDPGSGKSSLIFGWGEWKLGEGEKVVWISQTPSGYTCTDFVDGKYYQVEFSDEKNLTIALVQKKYTLIILDGIRRCENRGYTIEWWVCTLYKNVPVDAVIVFCTSMQSAVRVNLVRYSEFFVRQFFLDSWDVSDINAARDLALTRNEPILPPDIIASREAFYDRLYFSGSSIRFIGLPVKEIRSALDNELKAFNIHKLRSDDFNVLLRHASNQVVVSFISPYVQYAMENSVELQEVLRARNLALYNNSFQGWIHEFAKRVVFRTAHKQKTPVVLKREGSISITSKRVRVFTVDEIQDYNELFFCLDKTIPEGRTTLFIPTKCNPGCFDFVEVSRPSLDHYSVTFYQLTVSEEHDLDFFYAGSFLAKLFPRKLTKEMQLRFGAKRTTSADIPTFFKKTSSAGFSLRRTTTKHASLLEAQRGISAVSLPSVQIPDDMVTKSPAEAETIARPPVKGAGVKFQAGSPPEQSPLPERESPLPPAGAATVRVELDHNINTKIRVHIYYIIEPTIKPDFNLHRCSFNDELSVAIFDNHFTIEKVRVGTLEPYMGVKR